MYVALTQTCLNNRISLIINGSQKEEVVSFEEMLRRKRNKLLEESNIHLTEIFSKVKEEDKGIIKKVVKTWLKQDGNSEKTTQELEVPAEDWEKCKQKIITVLPDSYFFIDAIYEEIAETASRNYYMVDGGKFSMLLELFTSIFDSLKLKETSTITPIYLEFVFRMIRISMKIMRKETGGSSPGQLMEVLCHSLGKRAQELHHEDIFYRIFGYLQKKRLQNKIDAENEPSKNLMDNFMKGMQEAMSLKREVKLTDQESLGCLIELTDMMANLLIPNDVAIAVLKKLLLRSDTKLFENFR
jgi:hypothetical protein